MTEIEKMYENCNFEKAMGVGSPLALHPFTAEKQLKIIQLLSNIRGDIQLCYSDNQYIFVVNFKTAKCQWANKYHEKIDEALADMVNVLWQSITDQEKEEIRRILNE